MKKYTKYLIAVSAIILVLCCVFSACKKSKKDGDDDTTTTEITTLSLDEFFSENGSDAPTAENGLAGDPSVIDNASAYVPSTKAPSTGKTVRLLDGYRALASSEEILMKFSSTDAKGAKASMTGAINRNGDIYFQTNASDIDMNFAILVVGGKSYMLLPDKKQYAEVPDTGDPDVDFNQSMTDSVNLMKDMLSINPDEMTYVSTTTAKENGKTLTCETYKTADGQNKYYFDGATLVKIAKFKGETANEIIDIEKISTDVDANIFAVPSGWLRVPFYSLMTEMITEMGYSVPATE